MDGVAVGHCNIQLGANNHRQVFSMGGLIVVSEACLYE